MDYDRILSEAGSAGLYQMVTFILMGFVNCYVNLENMAVNFMSPWYEHSCHIPVPSNANTSYEEVKSLAIPAASPGAEFDPRCTMYGVTWLESSGNYSYPDINSSITHTCTQGYDFETGEFEVTATSHFELVCEDLWILEAVSPFYAAGLMIGAISAGSVSDRFGRMTALTLFTVVHIVAAAGVALSPNAWVYMMSRMLIAVAVRATGITGPVIMMETMAPAYRVRAIIGYQLFYALGGFALVGTAYLIRHFRLLQLVVITPVIPMLLYKCIFPESPRWLQIKGRIDESVKSLQRIAARNGRTLSDTSIQLYVQQSQANFSSTNSSGSSKSMGFSTLLADPVLRLHMCAAAWMMMSANFVFFAVSLNMDQLFGDVYMNVLLSVCAEVPMVLLLWYLMEAQGRQVANRLMFTLMAVSSALSVAMELIGGLDMAVTLLSIAIRGCAICCICVGVCFVSELFPTPVRQMALGSATAMGGVATIAASFGGLPLKSVWAALPSTLFTVLAVISVVFSFFLPETLGKQLPDSVEDVYRLRTKSPDTDSVKSPYGEKSEIATVAVGLETPSKLQPSLLDSLAQPGTYAYYGPQSVDTRL